MDTSELNAQFEREGYLVLEDFFSESVMDHLDTVIRGYYGDNPDFWHTDEFMEKSYTEVVPWFPQREGNHAFDVIEIADARGEQFT